MESKSFISGFLAGAVLGAAVGILLVSSTSDETKKKLVKGAKKITDSLGETFTDALDGLKEQYIETVEEAATKGKETLSNASQKAKFNL